jgi:hypothetical protein
VLAVAALGGAPLQAAPAPFDLPVAIDGGRHHLIDRAGRPFFYLADSAARLLVGLDRAGAVEYLRDRRIRGFTAVATALVGPPGTRNQAGELPFLDDDFSRPSERYFDHADQIVRSAEALKLLLALAPAPRALAANGPERCRAYGQWLGKRYGRFTNILWVLGGNGELPSALESWRALARGLKETAPKQLVTLHPGTGAAGEIAWSEPSEARAGGTNPAATPPPRGFSASKRSPSSSVAAPGIPMHPRWPASTPPGAASSPCPARSASPACAPSSSHALGSAWSPTAMVSCWVSCWVSR